MKEGKTICILLPLYYGILGISRNSFNAEELKSRYRTLAKELHPDTTKLDKTSAEEKFKDLNEANACLNSERARTDYDKIYVEYQAEKEKERLRGQLNTEGASQPRKRGTGLEGLFGAKMDEFKKTPSFQEAMSSGMNFLDELEKSLREPVIEYGYGGMTKVEWNKYVAEQEKLKAERNASKKAKESVEGKLPII